MKQILRELRTQSGLTQADLAQRLGVSRQAVIALETDKHDPSLDLAYKISGVFDRPVEAIFENPYRPENRPENRTESQAEKPL